MANTPSAIKRIRQTARRNDVNRRNRSRLRTQIKKLQTAIDNNDAESANQLLKPTVSVVDKSVQKGLLKKKTASRMKSRLTRNVAGIAAASSS